MPCGDAKAERDAAHALLEDGAQSLAEGGHRLEVVVQAEEDELVAAVADEDVAAVDLVVDDGGDVSEHLIAREVPVRVVDLLEVVDVKEGKGEPKPALVREGREPRKVRVELMAVVAAREEVALGGVLRCDELLREALVLALECRLLHHLDADEVEDERYHGVDGEHDRGEYPREEMVLPVQHVKDEERGEGDQPKGSVAARGVVCPVGADECMDEDEI